MPDARCSHGHGNHRQEGEVIADWGTGVRDVPRARTEYSPTALVDSLGVLKDAPSVMHSYGFSPKTVIVGISASIAGANWW